MCILVKEGSVMTKAELGVMHSEYFFFSSNNLELYSIHIQEQ